MEGVENAARPSPAFPTPPTAATAVRTTKAWTRRTSPGEGSRERKRVAHDTALGHDQSANNRSRKAVRAPDDILQESSQSDKPHSSRGHRERWRRQAGRGHRRGEPGSTAPLRWMRAEVSPKTRNRRKAPELATSGPIRNHGDATSGGAPRDLQTMRGTHFKRSMGSNRLGLHPPV